MTLKLIRESLSYEILDNEIWNIALAILSFLLAFFVLPFIKNAFTKKIKKLSEKTETDIDDLFVELIDKIGKIFFAIIAIFIGSKFLILPERTDKWINLLMIIIVTIETTRATIKVTTFSLHKYSQRSQGNESIIQFGSGILKFAIWGIAILFLMQNLGINITSLIAGLGIGGIAIALALQNILGDMFSSLSIYFDQPFKVGDYITVGENKGTVKKVGIKTTRLESISGEEIVISNKDLTGSRINNFKKMQKRRGSFQIGVEYSTPLKKLKKIPELITKIGNKIADMEIVRVHFIQFGAHSLDFEIVYWILDRDFDIYRDRQQELNLAIFEAFEREKISFAYPTNTVYLEKS